MTHASPLRLLDLGSLITTRPALPLSLTDTQPGPLRAAVVATWHGRMVNEWMSSFVFLGLSRQLASIGEGEAAACARTFADEERRHGVACASVVSAAGGTPKAMVAPPQRLPAHLDTTPRVAVLRNTLSICCLSETVAVALIGAERLEMPEGPLRALLTEIWADEVGHARFGWELLDRLLPTLTASEHAELAAYVPHALAHLEAHELLHLPVGSEPPAEGAAFGVCSGRAARSLFFDTVETVIVPELGKRGLTVSGSGLAAGERKVA